MVSIPLNSDRQTDGQTDRQAERERERERELAGLQVKFQYKKLAQVPSDSDSLYSGKISHVKATNSASDRPQSLY